MEEVKCRNPGEPNYGGSPPPPVQAEKTFFLAHSPTRLSWKKSKSQGALQDKPRAVAQRAEAPKTGCPHTHQGLEENPTLSTAAPQSSADHPGWDPKRKVSHSLLSSQPPVSRRLRDVAPSMGGHVGGSWGSLAQHPRHKRTKHTPTHKAVVVSARAVQSGEKDQTVQEEAGGGPAGEQPPGFSLGRKREALCQP